MQVKYRVLRSTFTYYSVTNVAFLQGAANCLEGLTFVISGVLDSIERDEAAEIIKKYGGRVTSAVSKKTDYLVSVIY